MCCELFISWATWRNNIFTVSYSCHWVAQTALHPEVTHQGPHSAALCDSVRVCRTKTSLKKKKKKRGRGHNAQLRINSTSKSIGGKSTVIVLIPCLLRFPSLRKQLPSHSRLSRCCLISSKISGWILSRSSLQHKHSISNRDKHVRTHAIYYYWGRAGFRMWDKLCSNKRNVCC